jgi:hypothetical protein
LLWGVRAEAPGVGVFGELAETCEKVEKGLKVLVDGKPDISESSDKKGHKTISSRTLADTYRLPRAHMGGISASLLLVLGRQRVPPTLSTTPFERAQRNPPRRAVRRLHSPIALERALDNTPRIRPGTQVSLRESRIRSILDFSGLGERSSAAIASRESISAATC